MDGVGAILIMAIMVILFTDIRIMVMDTITGIPITIIHIITIIPIIEEEEIPIMSNPATVPEQCRPPAAILIAVPKQLDASTEIVFAPIRPARKIHGSFDQIQTK